VNTGSFVGPTPYLSTSYGPLTYGINIAAWPKVTPGFYSPLTDGFSASGGTATGVSRGISYEFGAPSSDGDYGTFCGYDLVGTPYGNAYFGIEYRYLEGVNSPVIGRWGNYNVTTGLFYPASSTYYNVA
jgi:hypothetical protein